MVIAIYLLLLGLLLVAGLIGLALWIGAMLEDL